MSDPAQSARGDEAKGVFAIAVSRVHPFVWGAAGALAIVFVVPMSALQLFGWQDLAKDAAKAVIGSYVRRLDQNTAAVLENTELQRQVLDVAKRLGADEDRISRLEGWSESTETRIAKIEGMVIELKRTHKPKAKE
ncbi:MAG: hypothetical protein ACRCXD_01640 [Luteolibacter sp.]